MVCGLYTVRDNTFVIDDREQIQEGIKLYSHPTSMFQPDYVGRKQIAASFFLDLPTGATVVCAFGLVLLGVGVIQWLRQKQA